MSYYLDCVDGHYARKYNMTSKFGDYFDHYSDILKILLLLYCMYQKDKKMAMINSIILGVLLVLMTVHFGCQQKIKEEKHEDEPFMNISKQFCPDPNWIHKTKHFGSGTFYLIVLMMILYTKFKS
jgi:phosphatidylglycerophosphate synthase